MSSPDGQDDGQDGLTDVDEITAVAQDYLKAIWSATEWGGPPVTTKALARRFGTTAANVSETVKRLAGQGLVTYRPYQPVELTARGTALALTMVRRHRMVETFLVTTLGYDGDEVHDEAERLEHAVSDRLIARIDALLGHPLVDPHGDPIPRADGAVQRPADTIALSTAGPGRYEVVRVSDAEAGPLAGLLRRGVRPNEVVSVEPAAADPARGDAVVLDPDGLPLDEQEAALIRVRAITP